MYSYAKFRNDALVVQKVKDETLVFDQATKKAHCLNRSCAEIWEACDGFSSEETISAKLGLPVEFVISALHDLKNAGLLEQNEDHGPSLPPISRRSMLMKTGATAAAIPVITGIIAPKAVQAQSCLGSNQTFELPGPYADVQTCVDALVASAQTTCCGGTLNPQAGFEFGTVPPLCRGRCV
ncbi:MAG: PqqD family protein [Acidobacteria bacterium]|nr:PqqD family protein [Acidobacteriota bacterium]